MSETDEILDLEEPEKPGLERFRLTTGGALGLLFFGMGYWSSYFNWAGVTLLPFIGIFIFLLSFRQGAWLVPPCVFIFTGELLGSGGSWLDTTGQILLPIALWWAWVRPNPTADKVVLTFALGIYTISTAFFLTLPYVMVAAAPLLLVGAYAYRYHRKESKTPEDHHKLAVAITWGLYAQEILAEELYPYLLGLFSVVLLSWVLMAWIGPYAAQNDVDFK